MLVRTVRDNPRSYTFMNLRYLRLKTGLEEVYSYADWKVREALRKKNVPENEKWRLELLTTLLNMKMDKLIQVQDSKQLCAMIDSLCST